MTEQEALGMLKSVGKTSMSLHYHRRPSGYKGNSTFECVDCDQQVDPINPDDTRCPPNKCYHTAAFFKAETQKVAAS
jgi:hypothetical protein